MFPDGAKDPFDRTRRIIAEARRSAEGAAEPVVDHRATPRRAGVPPRPGYGPWELSADRANAVRQILEDEGLPGSHVSMVAGKADSQPLFPDDPHIAANRRVTITLMREAPPLPTGLQAVIGFRYVAASRDRVCRLRPNAAVSILDPSSACLSMFALGSGVVMRRHLKAIRKVDTRFSEKICSTKTGRRFACSMNEVASDTARQPTAPARGADMLRRASGR